VPVIFPPDSSRKHNPPPRYTFTSTRVPANTTLRSSFDPATRTRSGRDIGASIRDPGAGPCRTRPNWPQHSIWSATRAGTRQSRTLAAWKSRSRPGNWTISQRSP